MIPSAPEPAPTPAPPSNVSIVLVSMWQEGKTLAIGLLLGIILSMAWMPRPAPQPTPTPVPVPVPVPPGPTPPTPTPNPPGPGPVVPVSDFFQLGKDYKQKALINARVSTWSALATQIASGINVADALKTCDANFTGFRQQFFDQSISPELEKLAPAGTNPDPGSLARAFTDLAKGVAAP